MTTTSRNPIDSSLVIIQGSCTWDDAVAKMLGWLQGNLRARFVPVTLHGIPLEALPTAHSIDGSLQEQLQDMLNAARCELIDADESGADDEVIEQKADLVIECEELIARAGEYSIALTDELARGEASAVRIDHDATRRTGETHVTLGSLDAWARDKFKIAVLENSSKEHVQTTPDSKPWNIADPRDPEPEQPWYTPARYFARQLVKEDSTLLTKRDVLARKVVQSLTGVGFLKRGNFKPLDPGTVRKAFSKVSLG